jgi:membrane protease YdiL (CAAX protease family)
MELSGPPETPPPPAVDPRPAPDIPPPGEQLEPGGWPQWPWWFGFVGFVGALLLPASIGIVLGITAGLTDPNFDPTDIEDNPVVTLVGGVAQDISFVLVAVLLAWTVARPYAWQFGLRRARRFWPAVGLSLLTLVATYAFTFAYSAGVGLEEQQSTLDDLGVGTSPAVTAAAAVLVVVLAPLVEEFFFRGFLYRSFRTNLGVWPAALGAGAIFGAVHATTGVEYVPILIFLGVALCLLYERTGSLYAPIAVHAVNNSLAFAASTEGADPTLPLALGGGMLLAVGIGARFSGRHGPQPATATA